MRVTLGIRRLTITSRDGWQRRFAWWWLAPVIAIPVVLLVATLVFAPEPLHFLLAQRIDRAQQGRGATALLAHTTETAIENLTAARPVRSESPLPSYRITVPNNTLVEMQSALTNGAWHLAHEPGGKKPYFDALVQAGDRGPLPCRVALRGWSPWHHRLEKPSLRVRLARDDAFDGRRYHELQRPEDVLALKNWIPDALARRRGLLSERSDHVRVFINRKYRGVYLRTMRHGEPLALAAGRLPGTFFKGDFDRDVHLRRQTGCRSLWDSSAAWRIEGEADPADIARLDTMLDILREPPSAAALERLATVLDTDAYATWAALMIVTGSVHADSCHNHSFFVCGNQGRLEPLAWDANGYGIHSDPHLPPDFVAHPIMEMLLADPRWVHRRNQAMYELLTSDAAPGAFATLVDETLAHLRRDLESDLHLADLTPTDGGWQLVPFAVTSLDRKRDELVAWATVRHRFLLDYLDDAAVRVAPSPDRPGWSRVTVSGSVAVMVDGAGGTPTPGTDPAAPARLDPGRADDVELYRFADGPDPWNTRAHVLFAPPAPLEYLVEGAPEALRFTNAVTGGPVAPRMRAAGAAPAAHARTVPPGAFTPPAVGAVALGPGDVRLDRDLVIGPRQRLEVRPGTTIRLAPGVGIYARGPVTMSGRADAPVTIRGTSDAPWASIGLSGPSTAGSTFEHVDMAGGGPGTDGIARYKGMLSVYDCPSIALRDCRFGMNPVGDDAVNLAESTVVVERCTWEDAPFDGLDLDRCDGTVRACVFRRCGNDGLDVMTSRVTIADARFEACGDKGISIGENSRVVIEDSTFTACGTGCQSKDASRAVVRRTRFESCGVAVHAYRKKWVYERGGTVLLEDCTLRESRVADISAGRRSDFVLVRTGVEGTVVGADRVRTALEAGPAWRAVLEPSPATAAARP